MTEQVGKIFDFACANPDYWELMRQTYEPPEVAELAPRRREAFNAARKEVQRQYRILLDAVHNELKARASGTAMAAGFDRGFKQPSYEKAALRFTVFSGRGKVTWTSASVELGSTGRVSAYCSLETPARRVSSMLEAFETVVPKERLRTEGTWVYVEEPIALGDDISAIAARLVSVFWPGLEKYAAKLDAKSPQTSESDGDDDE